MHPSNRQLDNPSSLKNRVCRVVWNIAYLVFFRISPRPFHRWRSLILRLFGARVGKGVHVYPGVKIWAPWNLILKEKCGIGNGAILYSPGKITIGEGAVISQGAHLVTATHDYTNSRFRVIIKPITIGDNAWIAAEAFIHPGVNIGKGCVIGARSVVTKDMPDWMVCVGNPCKPVKARVFLNEIKDLNTNEQLP